MPEYVYAHHNFVPEKPDEIPFKAGDRIEVIEKDDLYQDGWWQGRKPQGQMGLFPETYTKPYPPGSSSVNFPAPSTSTSATESSTESPIAVSSTALDTLQEEQETSTTRASSTPEPGDRERTTSGQMMQETMTDVQKAIEQLGRNDRDGARSFSFVSSHGDYTDRSATETEGETEDEDAPGWHKGAREKLAMRAAKEIEERRAKEAAESSIPATPIRITSPPIDFELSDESEGDDDDEHLQSVRTRHSDPFPSRQHPFIPEEEEEAGEAAEMTKILSEATVQGPSSPPTKSQETGSCSSHIEPSEDFIVPLPDESDMPTATATQTAFPVSAPTDVAKSSSPIPTSPPRSPTLPPSPPAIAVLSSPAPAAVPILILAAHAPPLPASVEPVPEIPSESQQATPHPEHTPILRSVSSNVGAGQQLPFQPSPATSPTSSTMGSIGPASSVGIQQALTPATTVTSFKTATPSVQQQLSASTSSAPSTKPVEWSVEEVIEWLKSKGIDQVTCEKFAEQEISGDVLLELNHDILKTEIGVVAFGKRARIMNFIAELKRPPSPSESEKQVVATAATSRTHSISYSHSHSASMQSSAHHSYNGIPFYGGPQFSPVSSHMVSSPSAPPASAGVVSSLSMDSSPHTGEFTPSVNGWRASDPGAVSVTTLGEQQKEVTGLGLGLPNSTSSPSVNINGKPQKHRPSQLLLSPSDGALKTSAVIDDQRSFVSRLRTEDRDVLSDSETAHVLDSKQKRRRLFGRSAESASLKEKASSLKESSSRHSIPTPVSASPNELKSEFNDEVPPMRRHSKKQSTDRKASDRLSLFGSPFSATIGKSRKPPPRISTSAEKTEEKHHLSTFTRIERKITMRPSTSDGTRPKEKAKDIQVLRKRTTSTAESIAVRPAATAVQALGPNLERGKSILEQIGTPDHNGWMRKKSDRYNSWKTRYFVLKGPHLYILKSNSSSETKIKGYINIIGYRVSADENVDPGRYGFQIMHDTDRTHYFSSEDQLVVREWMKALMKATITRDYTNPVVSSNNIPTIPLTVAQAMNPAPRPPSPTARAATQRAHRRDNPNQLSTRDAEVLLMGMPDKPKSLNGHSERTRLDSFFTDDSTSTKGKDTSSSNKSPSPSKISSPPPRPSRETRRASSQNQPTVDISLIEWANSHLPESLQVKDLMGPLYTGLALLRLAENIKGKPSSPPVPDSAFPSHPDDDKLDGLFRLFDFLLDNDVKMGSVSINDIRQGKRDKILQLLRAMKAWEEKRRAIAQSIGKGSITAGPFMAIAGAADFLS